MEKSSGQLLLYEFFFFVACELVIHNKEQLLQNMLNGGWATNTKANTIYYIFLRQNDALI